MSDDYAPTPPEAHRPKRLRPAGWALGLPAVALLWIASTLWLGPAIEHEIRRETMRLAAREPGSPLAGHRVRAEIGGRDVRVVSDPGLAADDRSRAEDEIGRIRGVRTVRSAVTVPVAMAPFELRMRRSASGIALAGGVPSPGLRAALVERAATMVPADSVDDRLTLATGAPDGFAGAAEAALVAIGRASSGEAVLVDRTLRLRAVAETSSSYDAILAALRDVPAGFGSVVTDILPPIAAPFVWSARRDEAGVVLAGAVPSEPLRARLAALAAAALPGIAVRDEMRTARGLDPGLDFAAVASVALSGLATLQAGRAELAGKRLSLDGEGVARARLDALEGRLRAGLPAGFELGPVSLRAVPASPFRFLARRADGRVTLSGFVPDEASRRAAAATVAARFPGERLVDERLAADGAPSGFAEAERVALEVLSDFAEGEAVIRDRDLRFSGRMLYRQLAARTRDTVPRMAPAGWTVAVAIDPVAPERALDATLCGDLLADTARRDPIRFEPGKPDLAPAARAAVDAAADIVRRCGEVGIRIVHHLRGGDETAQGLATQRAAALVTALSERGVGGRLSGEGVVAPPATGASSERTEFVVASP